MALTPELADPAVRDRIADEPMSKVLGLDARTSSLGAWLGFTSGSATLLAACFAGAVALAWAHARGPAEPPPVAEIEIEKEEVPPPTPPPQPELDKTEPAPVLRAAPRETRPSPAQAAKVLTREPAPEEPLDLTGNTFVQGTAEAFAGGYTSSHGTSARAVLGIPSPLGPSAGAERAPPVTTPDRSRVASLSGDAEWSCPFPPEADSMQLDDAYVTLEVGVDASGGPVAVRVLSDPGNGFGREARRCALSKRYLTALDRDGKPIVGTTRPFRVHFSR